MIDEFDFRGSLRSFEEVHSLPTKSTNRDALPHVARRIADPLIGYATGSLVRLDAHAPGLISRVLTASPLSRQAIFSVIATRLLIIEHNDAFGRVDDGDEVNLAFVLRQGRAREILGYAFGEVPIGWLGALARLGGQPMQQPHSYVKLHSLFANPKHRTRAEALRHVGQIGEKTLSVLDALDDRWVHGEALKRLPSVVAAKDFNRAVAFAQAVSSKATDEAVAAAIARLEPDQRLSAVINRFVRRADRFPPHPVDGDDEIRPLTSVRDFIAAGRRYRNCLTSMFDEALAAQVAFAEFRREAIVEFRPLTLGRGWLLHDVHVERNGPVAPELRSAAELKCGALGIPHLDERNDGEDWRRYRRFVRQDELPQLAV